MVLLRKSILSLVLVLVCLPVSAQTPPSRAEIKNYSPLFQAVVEGDPTRLAQQIEATDSIDQRDGYGRTALHVATYYSNHEAMSALVNSGADANALEHDFYDLVTIAAVANDLSTMKLALKLGCKSTNVTSRYDGTALIAAAHLGHVEVVKTLIHAGAPLDHVNNLNWTALIESIVLGDGGHDHIETLRALVDAGADVNLPDGRGYTPLRLAKERSYQTMVELLLAAGAR